MPDIIDDLNAVSTWVFQPHGWPALQERVVAEIRRLRELASVPRADNQTLIDTLRLELSHTKARADCFQQQAARLDDIVVGKNEEIQRLRQVVTVIPADNQPLIDMLKRELSQDQSRIDCLQRQVGELTTIIADLNSEHGAYVKEAERKERLRSMRLSCTSLPHYQARLDQLWEDYINRK